VPFSVKNLFDVEGLVTLAGSRVLADRPPAGADAAAVAALRGAGAVLTGTTNMDEFAFGFTTENHHYGPARNPHDVTRIAGGSSGGSAAAVAAGLVPISLGTDTNGSVRVPASFCGVFGLKPTYGRLSRRGVQLFSTSLDHVGPFARSVADLSLVYNALQGRDPEDPKQSPANPEPVALDTTPATDDLRIAVLGGHFRDHASQTARAAVAMAADALGAQTEVVAPLAAAARAAAAIITYAEAGDLHIDWVRHHRSRLDPLIRDRLTAAALTPAAWYVRAQRVRTAWRQQLQDLFRDCDVLLAPATPDVAHAIGTETIELNGETLPARAAVGLLTQPLTLAGLPIAVAPVWPGGPLPIGVQIIAPPWREDLVLGVAAQLEQAGVARAPVANP
jgi:AtzE family amidohydrolase